MAKVHEMKNTGAIILAALCLYQSDVVAQVVAEGSSPIRSESVSDRICEYSMDLLACF